MTIYGDQFQPVSRAIQFYGGRELGDSLTMVVHSNMNARKPPKLQQCVLTLPRHYGEKTYLSQKYDHTLDFGMNSHRKIVLSNSLDDDDTSSSVNDADLDQEEEYVTLDRNYGSCVQPSDFRTLPKRQLPLLEIKRNRFDTDSRNYKNQEREKRLLRNSSVQETSKTISRTSLRRIAKNITSVISPRPAAEDDKKNSIMTRSKSYGDLYERKNEREKDDDSSSCYSDDDDGDDFGFLSYPFASSSAMHKAKSPSASHRILPKIWKGKPKGGTAGHVTDCLWTPEDKCTWCSMSGRKVELRPINLVQLSEQERLALQKIALSKLQNMDFGCPVSIPKESTASRRKRNAISFRRKSKSANISSALDKLSKDKEDSKESPPSGLVFGIPISRCIANDIELQKRRALASLRERSDSIDIVMNRRQTRKSSSSSQSSLEHVPEHTRQANKMGSFDSLSESQSSRRSSSLIDALSLSASREGSLKQESLSQTASRIPHIVKVCFKHIETYGLRTLGIFRVGASKKRLKQLREEFDSGRDVKLTEAHNHHDIGALIKEYFRELPEPLLTRDLYSPFIASRQITDPEKQAIAIKYLLALLPVPNRDTLIALLQFLSKVVEHSTDSVDANGELLPGNKMDSNNLATLFGPNILHKAKNSGKEFLVESLERAEEPREVIEVVKDMIDNYQSVFVCPAEFHDDILRLLIEVDPDSADQILKGLAADIGPEMDQDVTGSSEFEESDSPSLQYCPSSEVDLTQLKAYANQTHLTLRPSRSAENITPRTRRKLFFSNSNSEGRKPSANPNVGKHERPKFRLHIEGSPSPKPSRTPSGTRPPKMKISRESSSPDLTRWPESEFRDRPKSFTQCLAIPQQVYGRQNSGSSASSLMNTSPTNSPASSECSGHWGLPTPPNSGKSSPKNSRKITSSQQRPLDLRPLSAESSEWQKERWRQWEMLASGKPDESYEQETLV